MHYRNLREFAVAEMGDSFDRALEFYFEACAAGFFESDLAGGEVHVNGEFERLCASGQRL